MNSNSRSLMVALSTLAGFVDALGHISLGGFFVAFMSGNSTLLSIGVARLDFSRIGLAGGLVASFVVGVLLATLVGRMVGPRRQPAVLGLIAALLAVAWALQAAGGVTPSGMAMAVAMGAENTVFQTSGHPAVGITYMTGTLVRIGHRLAHALIGESWVPVLQDVLLWTAMITGALLGGLAYGLIGLDGLWAAAAAAILLGAILWFRRPPPGSRSA